MLALAFDHTIHYRITVKPTGVTLTFWEPALKTEERTKPYLYLANYAFSTEDEAKAMLKRHLVLNGANGVSSLNLPTEGKIRVMPYPTWPNCEVEIFSRQAV